MSIQAESARMRRGLRDRRGMTLIELGVVLGVVAVVVLMTAPNVIRWQRDQRLKGAARDVADLLLLARAESARTGNRHIVVYGPIGTAEPGGTAIESGGSWVPIIAFGDGPPTTSNCKLDAGEAREAVRPADGVRWGVSQANVRAPGDEGAAAFAPPQASGGTTADPGDNFVPWLMFRPDGVPVPLQGSSGGNCDAIGATASGGAALYLTNGRRDYAVVLSPMGGVRVHVWNPAGGGWST